MWIEEPFFAFGAGSGLAQSRCSWSNKLGDDELEERHVVGGEDRAASESTVERKGGEVRSKFVQKGVKVNLVGKKLSGGLLNGLLKKSKLVEKGCMVSCDRSSESGLRLKNELNRGGKTGKKKKKKKREEGDPHEWDFILLSKRHVKREEIEDKVFWITGASRGIGEVLAKQLASLGAKVIISARNEAELERVKKQLTGKHAPSEVMVLPLDLTSGEDVLREAVEKAETFFAGAGVDYLIHNAAYERPVSYVFLELKCNC
ncbi:hypothetical protein RJ639_040014 [Escallonia herrerae]|uniref:Dehydrogenase/reductase SDR family member 7 n=1 Tax=Escallonia herrerae TaxID=1293975 RepID=A0AA88WLZ1_9ASTE|nr:hypothetical protein RJ639_040014 [Escallonia herrerae]